MKQLKKLTLLSVAVSSVMALSACSNGNSTGGGNNQKNTSPLPQKIEVDLNDKVKVLDQAVNKDVTKVTVDDNQHLVLEVSNPQSELTNKKVGDIVYLPPKTANDLGVFVKIKEIKTNSNGSTQVITEQPDGAEVFDNVNANVTGVKPKILSIIAPNSDLSKVKGLSQNSGLQQGLTGLEQKITIPISLAISKPKRQYSSSAFTSYKRYCAYPKSFAEHKGITYDKALTELEKLCDTALKLEGSVELNIGEIVNTMDIQKNSSGELTAKSGKISLKDTEFSINLKSQLYAKELRLSEMIGISDRYAEQYFKDYQRTSVDGYFAKVAVTGLSADDKKGKIPLGGFVFGAGGAIFVKGTETDIATSLASPLGGVAMVYGIIDATGKISLEVEYVYNSGKKEIGIEQKDNKISAIPQDTVADATAKSQININGEISGETQIGGAIEGDFFLGGVRFANLGGQYVQKRNGSLTGNYKYDFLKNKHSIQGCYSWGIGQGFIFYGNLALGVEGTLDVGFFKTQGQAGFQYGFMYPEKEKQTDPTFVSPLWKYTNMVGTKKYPEICISALPSEFSIEKVQQYSIHQSHLTEVPVNIVIDRKEKNDAGVKYTTPEKYQVQIGKYDPFGFKVNSWSQPIDVWVNDDGIVTLPFHAEVDEYGMPKAPFAKSNRISVPYGKSVIKVIAIDKLGRKTEKTINVTIQKQNNAPIINGITTSPLQLTAGQPFELIITGKNLPTDNMFTVNGCTAQTQVSLAVDKHIYKCTAPATATDNYNLSVVGIDGKTAIFNKQFKVTKYDLLNENQRKIFDDFTSATLDTNKWTVKPLRQCCYGNGSTTLSPATYSLENGNLVVNVVGKSNGYMGHGDGSYFIPNIAYTSGDFEYEISLKEILRKQNGYKDNSGVVLQLFTDPTINSSNKNYELMTEKFRVAFFGNYSGYYSGFNYNQYQGHRFDVQAGNNQIKSVKVDLNNMYKANLRIRRENGVIYGGWKLENENYVEYELGKDNSAVKPLIQVVSVDGGNTLQNGDFKVAIDWFSIK